jgi:hypothetical protein
MVAYDKKIVDKYGLTIFAYETLPDIAPNGFWAISNNLIISRPESLASHYGAAIVFLSSLGIKKYQIKLKFILSQYGSLSNLANGVKRNDIYGDDDVGDLLGDNKVLSYDDIYQSMYSSPINAVRVNLKYQDHDRCDITTPFLERNKSGVRLSKDIALFYNKPYNLNLN